MGGILATQYKFNATQTLNVYMFPLHGTITKKYYNVDYKAIYESLYLLDM